MALLKIARMGHPVLRQIAEPVRNPISPEIQILISDMLETLADCGGIGLAAPQVHVPLRVVIYSVPGERMNAEGEDGPGVPMTVLINPRIEILGEEREIGPEACLSVPGLIGMVERWRSIRLTALGADGAPFEREAHGFHARVIQHECDHLDGVLYPQRMTDMTTLAFAEEARRYAAQAAAD
jgi:peptide deformylase